MPSEYTEWVWSSTHIKNNQEQSSRAAGSSRSVSEIYSRLYQVGFADDIASPAIPPDVYIPLHNLMYSKLLDDCTGEKMRTTAHCSRFSHDFLRFPTKEAVIRYLVKGRTAYGIYGMTYTATYTAAPDNHFAVALKLKLPFKKKFVMLFSREDFFHAGYFLRLPGEQVHARKYTSKRRGVWNCWQSITCGS